MHGVCVYVYVYTYVYVCMCMGVHVHVHVCFYLLVWECAYVDVPVRVFDGNEV